MVSTVRSWLSGQYLERILVWIRLHSSHRFSTSSSSAVKERYGCRNGTRLSRRRRRRSSKENSWRQFSQESRRCATFL